MKFDQSVELLRAWRADIIQIHGDIFPVRYQRGFFEGLKGWNYRTIVAVDFAQVCVLCVLLRYWIIRVRATMTMHARNWCVRYRSRAADEFVWGAVRHLCVSLLLLLSPSHRPYQELPRPTVIGVATGRMELRKCVPLLL